MSTFNGARSMDSRLWHKVILHSFIRDAYIANSSTHEVTTAPAIIHLHPGGTIADDYGDDEDSIDIGMTTSDDISNWVYYV